MPTWSDGYVTDIAYEWYFFHELAPAHLDFACLLKGHTPPGRGGSFAYLELGTGLGLTSTILAATNPTGTFWGVDVNPTHVVSAEALAEEAGIGNVSFIEAGFDELPTHELPAFDYIVLHGVWSWVSAATRASILDVIRTRLKPGGVVYISYNCAVGWGQVQSYGHLLRMLARLEHGPVENRLQSALGRLTTLSQQQDGFFDARPAAKAWLEQLRSYSVNYLAHEYSPSTGAPSTSTTSCASSSRRS
jgi:SAM-dependent methyltransferase